MYEYASHYSYDIQGNVKTLVREVKSLATIGHDLKQVDYEYDVISGKVNRVYYQRDEADQYIHEYAYDQDNRITAVRTGNTKHQLEIDAEYIYYHHGPLARVELGERDVQGIDYSYTINGWLKGVNSETLNNAREMGLDGNNTTNNPNRYNGRDEYGFILQYYAGDYAAAGGSAAETFVAAKTGSGIATNTSDLFNGNIAMMTTAIGKFMWVDKKPLGASYRYDQLNRIISADYYTNINAGTNAWQTGSATTEWHNRFTYDADGNILTQVRHASNILNQGVALDSLNYTYYSGTNRLRRVTDGISATLHLDDIDNQVDMNYTYDQIGNLIKDQGEEIDSIYWSVYGKITRIKRITSSIKPDLEFAYSPDGHRVMKLVIPKQGSMNKYTYYMRDAQGNIMATYDRTYDKIIDYDSLQYAAVNDSIIKYATLSSFSNFISTMHSGSLLNTGFNNYLEDKLNDTAQLQTNFLYANSAVAMLTADSVLLDSVIMRYDSLVYAMLNGGVTTAANLMSQACSCMSSKPTPLLNWAVLTTMTPMARQYLLQSMYTYNNTDFTAVMTTLGCATTPMATAVTCAMGKSPSAVLSAMQSRGYTTCATKFIDLWAEMNTQYPSQFKAIAGQVPELRNMVARISSYTCMGYTHSALATALQSYNSNYLWDKLIQVKGRDYLVAWFKTNNPAAYLSTITTQRKQWISSYQQTHNMYSAEGNGMANYFGQVRDLFTQSFYNDLSVKFYRSSRAYIDSLKVNDWIIYGSSRVGSQVSDLCLVNIRFYADVAGSSFTNRVDVETNEAEITDDQYTIVRGNRRYELSNHLGNVLAVLSDKKIYNCPLVYLDNTFDNGQVGDWQTVTTAYNFSIVSNKLRATATSAVYGMAGIYKMLDKTAQSGNEQYRVSFDLNVGTAGSVCVYMRSFDGVYTSCNTYGSSGTYSVIITGNSAQTQFVRFSATGATVGQYFELDNVKITKYETDSGYYLADVVSANDYSPFGAPLSGRTYDGISESNRTIVYNNTFALGTEGWTAYNPQAAVAVDGERLRLTYTNIWAKAQKILNLVPGKKYRMKFTLSMNDNGTTFISIPIYNLAATQYIAPSGGSITLTASGTYERWFTATEQTQLIFFEVRNTSVPITGVFYIDNFVLEEDNRIETAYRFGFNGQEKDNEVSGEGNSYTAEFWQYDPRLGRRFNVDPVVKPWESPYAAFANNPIWLVDKNGADTSFKSEEAKAEFNGAYANINNRIKSLEDKIKSLEQKGKDKGWSQEKLNKKINPLNSSLSGLKEVKSALDDMIKSPIKYIYKINNNIDANRGGETGQVDDNTILIQFRSGNRAAMIHESRHGLGFIKKEWNMSDGHDYQDEYDAFLFQQIYDAGSVYDFVSNTAKMMYPLSPELRASVTLKGAIEYQYKNIVKYPEFIQHYVETK
jgi:hypothetical protein